MITRPIVSNADDTMLDQQALSKHLAPTRPLSYI